jgi:hypothetical protein
MTTTTQQLAVDVLERIPVIGADETPSAADAQTVKRFYSRTLKELCDQGLAWWDEEDIPDEAFEALADVLAGRLAPRWGYQRPDLEQSGMARLRILSADVPTGFPVTGSYF